MNSEMAHEYSHPGVIQSQICDRLVMCGKYYQNGGYFVFDTGTFEKSEMAHE